jgi:hypothetical protein
MERFIKIMQSDIVTNPERWTDSEPGRFLELSNSAKNVYCVLSVISFSTAGSAKLGNGKSLGEGWFWTTNSLLQRLTGLSETQVQKGQRELIEDGFIEDHVDEGSEDKRYLKLTDVGYQPHDTVKKRTVPKENILDKLTDEDQHLIDIVRERLGEDGYTVLVNDHYNMRSKLTPEIVDKFKELEKSEAKRLMSEINAIYSEEGYCPF